MPRTPKRHHRAADHHGRVTAPGTDAPARPRPRRVTAMAWFIVVTFGLATVLPALLLLFG